MKHYYSTDIIELQLAASPPKPKLEMLPTPKQSPSNPRNVCPEKCEVCGGVATGYHYEVPSCNGCKTFFRRTVLAKTKFYCKRGGNCSSDLTKKKQHWCRACRFERCVGAGMNPLAISSVAAASSGNEVVKDIIRKRTADTCSTSYELEMIPPSFSSEEKRFAKLIDELLYVEFKKENFRRCRYNPRMHELPTLAELIRETNKLTLADTLGPMPNWPLPNMKPVTDEERTKWEKEGFTWRPPEEGRKNWLVFDLVSTVEYAKTFPFFHTLDDRDKLTLLRHVALVCYNFMQAFFSYEMKSENILNPDGTGLVHPGKGESRYASLYFLKNKFIVPLIRNRLDKKEYVLLKAILLCNPALSDLSPQAVEVMEKERYLLSKALFCLCLKEKGNSGPARFVANLSVIGAMERLTQEHRNVHVLMRLGGKTEFLRAISSADDHFDNDVVKDIIRKRRSEQCPTSSSYEVKLIPPSVSSREAEFGKIIDELLYLESKEQIFRRSRYNVDVNNVPSLQSLIRATNKMSLGDTLGPMPDWPLKTWTPLSEEEKMRLRNEGKSFRNYNGIRKNWLFFDLLSTVEYAKTFPFFHRLDEADQIVLLKNVALTCYNLMQAYFSYENKSDSILHPDGTNMVPPGATKVGYASIFDLKNSLIPPLIENMVDKQEYVLLKAMMLCNSGISGLSSHARKIVEKERVRINNALLSFCLKQRGAHGPSRYVSTLSVLDILERITEKQRCIHLLIRLTNQKIFINGAVAELMDNM